MTEEQIKEWSTKIFSEKYQTSEQLTEKWGSLGFLEDLPKDRKTSLSVAFELLGRYWLEKEDKEGKLGNDDDIMINCIFQVVRRIIYRTDITYDPLPHKFKHFVETILDINEEFTKFYLNSELVQRQILSSSYSTVDMDAELVAYFCYKYLENSN